MPSILTWAFPRNRSVRRAPQHHCYRTGQASSGRDNLIHFGNRGRDIVRYGERPHAAGPQAGRNTLDHRRDAGAKLMSAPASPGRTWSISDQRRMPTLVAAASATLYDGGNPFARLPDLVDPYPSAQGAKAGREGRSGRESGCQLHRNWRMDRAADSVLVRVSGGPA